MTENEVWILGVKEMPLILMIKLAHLQPEIVFYLALSVFSRGGFGKGSAISRGSDPLLKVMLKRCE